MSYTVDLTSASSNLKTFNNGTRVVGWNDLQGTSTFNGQAVSVDFLGDVSYLNGSGDFGGFYTMTFPDESTLILHTDGKATRNADGSTSLVSSMKVLGGTGVYVNATGTGQFTGSRAGTVGAPVHLQVTATLR